MPQADVVVVGAGLSGLSCARALSDRGARVTVLEARDRVGGRTLSRRIGGATFDLGGQWLGAHQPRLAALAAELGVKTFRTYDTGKKVLDAAGRTRLYSGTIPSLSPWALIDLQQALFRADRLARGVTPASPLAGKGAAERDGQSLGEWMRGAMHTEVAREVFATAIRVVFGAEPDELSLLWVLRYSAAAGNLMRLVEIPDGAQERRFVEGAQTLSVRLAERLGEDVVLNAPVRAIEDTGKGVIVTSDRGRFEARFAVMAVPPALAGRIAFSPPLPAPRDQLLQRFPMGATVKVLALYERAFWREKGLSGEAVFTRGPVSVVFDNTSDDGATPCLLAFVVGDPARRWSQTPEAARRASVLDAFTAAFGPEARRPVEFVEQDWSAEPWTRGCPTASVGPGVLRGAGGLLRAAVGAVHWAGTETADEWTGYLEGAIEAGQRAAAEVMSR